MTDESFEPSLVLRWDYFGLVKVNSPVGAHLDVFLWGIGGVADLH